MRLRNLGIIAAIGLSAASFSGSSASAQGFFDFFGFGRRPAPPPQVQPYASFNDEGAPVERRALPGTGYATYCVRLCDGHFFPLPRGANAADSCSSFCPAAKTKVFSGGGIDHAVSRDGKRYSDLENAFTYRDKVVDGCTCNGRNAFGIARVDVAEDPTLRSGDIVATSEGMATYRGKAKGVAQFTPIDKSKVSSEMRSRLANMRIAPEFNGEDKTASDTAGAQASETTGAPAASEKREKRTQR